MTYPIEPGSELDKAIDRTIAGINAIGPIPSDAEFGLIDRDNEAHMIALGTRTWLHLQGITKPNELHHAVHALWYGLRRP
jgi:hypothetical protein